VRRARIATAADGSRPIVVKVSRDGFHWRDAGIGALGAVAAGLVVFGLSSTVRNRAGVD
jgi:hypothetical protein